MVQIVSGKLTSEMEETRGLVCKFLSRGGWRTEGGDPHCAGVGAGAGAGAGGDSPLDWPCSIRGKTSVTSGIGIRVCVVL